jgi:esterase/lipase superfamily enzyme
MRAAQLSVDLEIDGATVLYSWPSQASLLGYVSDGNQRLDDYVEDLRALLMGVATQTKARRVHLVAHSMGAAFLLDALLAAMRQLPAGAPAPFGEIVFASPDVGLANFRSRVQRVRPLGHRVTVYTSRKDKALEISRFVNNEDRAGADAAAIALPGVECIDTTAASQGLIGHTDFAMTALDDVRSVIWLGLAPGRRRAILREEASPVAPYWRFAFESAAGDDGPFRSALFWARRIGFDEALDAIEKKLRAEGDRHPGERSRIDKVRAELRFLAGLE